MYMYCESHVFSDATIQLCNLTLLHAKIVQQFLHATKSSCIVDVQWPSYTCREQCVVQIPSHDQCKKSVLDKINWYCLSIWTGSYALMEGVVIIGHGGNTGVKESYSP